MKPIPQEDLHPLLLDVLFAFHRYCEAHSLTYFMSDGTLLGAVRHKGFIPWDDDVDVSMVDAEYDRLIEFAKAEPFLDDAQRYKFLLPAELPNFYPFLKVVDTCTCVYEKDISRSYGIGVWLDVFRFSHCDADFSKTLEKFHRVLKLKEMNKLAICGNFSTTAYKALSPFLAVGKGLLKLCGKTPVRLSEQMLEIERSMPKSGELLMDVTWADSDDHYFKAELWEEITLLEFEGRQFMAPKRYEEVLTAQYGDYMTLPPEKDRVRHDYEAYYLK